MDAEHPTQSRHFEDRFDVRRQAGQLHVTARGPRAAQEANQRADDRAVDELNLGHIEHDAGRAGLNFRHLLAQLLGIRGIEHGGFGPADDHSSAGRLLDDQVHDSSLGAASIAAAGPWGASRIGAAPAAPNSPARKSSNSMGAAWPSRSW